MKYLSAYCLLAINGKENISESDIENVIKSYGGEYNADQAKKVIDSLKDQSLDEIIKRGVPKLGGSGAAPSGNSAAPAQQEAQQEEEEEVDMGAGGLFGDDF